MKMSSSALWLFPVGLFVFLSLFTVSKFILIFFFSTAFEPLVLFDLTPLSFIPGFGSLQVLTLAMLALVADAYLHARATRHSLMLSYLPTGFLCSGVGLTIILAPASSPYIFHYAVFGCLLSVMIIDQKHLLTLPAVEPQVSRPQSGQVRYEEERPASIRRPSSLEAQGHVSMPASMVDSSMVDAFRASSELMIKNMASLSEFLDKRTQRLMDAEARLDERRDALIRQQEGFIDRLVSYHARGIGQAVASSKQESSVQDSQDGKVEDIVVDESHDWMMIVQRGIVKEMSRSFIDMLGYAPVEMRGRRFVTLMTPDGREDVRRHWHGNLTGAHSPSYDTVLLAKDGREIPVVVSVKPTLYHGAYADFLTVRQSAVTVFIEA